jgi:putative ABC transport system permease protein
MRAQINAMRTPEQRKNMKKTLPRAAIAEAGVVKAGARELFGDMDLPDQALRIRKVPFTMMGRLEKKGQSMTAQGHDDVVTVPLVAARNRLFGNAQDRLRRVGAIQVMVHEGARMKDSEDKTRDLFRDFVRRLSGPQGVPIIADTGAAL